MKKTWLIVALSVLSLSPTFAQDDSYQLPPKAIADLLLAKPTPLVRIDSKASYLLLLGRNSYPTVEELGQPEMKIAGLRLNPLNFSPSRQSSISSITLQSIRTGAKVEIAGLPKSLAAGSIAWNPSETKIAFTQTQVNGVDLYVIDLASKNATRVNNAPLNLVLGNAFTWVDDQTLLYKVTTHHADGAPKRPITPKGPTIQQNVGKAAPRPTFQDLIKSPYDESLFSYYAESQLVLYKNGVNKKIGEPALFNSFQLSPDRKYILTRTLVKPFSYAVPAYGFPTSVKVLDLDGKTIKEIAKLPSAESAPAGNDNVQNVPRGFDWRDDEPASLVYAMPLDSGFIKKQVAFHDAVYSLSAPFTQEAKELFKTKTRFAGVIWGNNQVALVTEVLRGKQTSKVSRYSPADGTMEVLYERNLTDAYKNPGSPVMTKNALGREVIQLTDNGTKILMNNPVGSSDQGDLPFISKFDLATKKNEIIWRAKPGYFEQVEEVIDADN
jgi:hypothetical protein